MRKSYIIFGPILWFLFGVVAGLSIWVYGPREALEGVVLSIQESYQLAYQNEDLRDVLLAIAQVEGVIAGIAIPLGLNMTSRIAERYKSSAVSTYFKRIFIFRCFPWMMLSILGANLIGVIFYSTVPGYWMALCSVFLMILSLGFFAYFLRTLQNHTDAHYLLKKVGRDVQKIISA